MAGADVSTLYKRAFLRKLYNSSAETGESLQDVLQAASDGSIQSTPAGVPTSGKVLTGSAANGHSYSWSVDPKMDPVTVTELVEELFERYESAKAKLIECGNATPTDAQIYAEMVDKLNAVDSVANDFTDLRQGTLCS
jgi:hypothetical protein